MDMIRVVRTRGRVVALLAAALLATPFVMSMEPALPPPAMEADFYDRDPAREALGQLLFYDKILSGNRNISCATCHHGLTMTGDGLALPVGEGGRGLGVTRDLGTGDDAIHERVPRNSPALFNLGAREFGVMFHDGRVELMPSHPTGFRSPAGDRLPPGLDNVLAVQAMFPVTSAEEMAGQPGENPVADAAAAGDLETVWALLADRLRAIPEYVALFEAAFDDVGEASDIRFVHAANAIAAFEAATRAVDSPFDRFLRGDQGALSANQVEGMALFYGAAGCAGCHSGTFQTNHGFAAIGMPQIGPGKGDDFGGRTGGRHDFGRGRVTGDRLDRMRFRVPSLRNVAMTGPWGHAGAYDDLEAVIRHHMRPRWSLLHFDGDDLRLPSRPDLDAGDMVVMHDGPSVGAIMAEIEIPVVPLSDREIARLIDFLHALTDPASLDRRRHVPQRVPSGLPTFE